MGGGGYSHCGAVTRSPRTCGFLGADERRVLSDRKAGCRRRGEASPRGLRQHRAPETGRWVLTRDPDRGMQPAAGSAVGRRRGPPLEDGAFGGCSPHPTSGLLAAAPHPLTAPRGAEQGAVAAAPPRRTRSRAARGQREARGWVRARRSLAAVRSARRRTRPLGLRHPAGPGRARASVCSPGPGRWGAAASPRAAPQDAAQVRPPRRRPSRRRARGEGRARPHLCPFFPRPGRGRWGARAGRTAAEALRAARRVRGAPAAIQLPGLAGSAARGAG